MFSPVGRTVLDSGLTCLVTVARLHQLPADPAQIQHEFGTSDRPFDTGDLLRAAKWLGLKARKLASSWSRLGETPMPAIARFGETDFVILAGVRDDQVLTTMNQVA